MGNKVAGVFSCGQRDLCHLSEAQPQAGNRTKYAVKYGVERRDNISKKWGKEGGTMHDKSNVTENGERVKVMVSRQG